MSKFKTHLVIPDAHAKCEEYFDKEMDLLRYYIMEKKSSGRWGVVNTINDGDVTKEW